MFETIKNAFKIKEVRKKIFWTIILILIYRIGCFIPVPGINAAQFKESIGGNDFLNIMSTITGGSLSNGTLFAIGISPYINASIIIQLLTVAIPALERLSKQGEEGRKKITQITRYVTIILAIVQAIGILLSFKNAGIIDTAILGVHTDGTPVMGGWLIYIFVVTMLTAGAAFTMWLGERITDKGVSNGISMLIFVGILSTAGTSIANALVSIAGDAAKAWELIAFLVAVILIFGAIVFVDGGERKIPVQYAKQIKGRKMYGGQSTFIPVRVNGSGVLPLIFAFALLSFPQLIINTFWATGGAAAWYAEYLGAGSWIYSVLLGLLILFFSYFYAQIQFNTDDVSKEIQQNGGFIPGIRPGKPTSDYLKRISNRITRFGAVFLAAIAIIPTLIFKAIGAGNEGLNLLTAFSATGMLIIVSVALEFDKA
jgi:preprotein translocase subunit SecY